MSKKVAWLLIAVAFLPGCSTPRRGAPSPAVAVEVLPRGPEAPFWRPIGFSVERRPLLVAQAGKGPLRIYLIGGVHGDETEGRSVLESLKGAPNAAATIRILRDLNPDGTAAYRRPNARGHDLNRNWPARNFTAGLTGGHAPLSEPETRALDQDLRAFKPDIVIALHSASIGPLINYDGPAEQLAMAFVGAAQTVSPEWHVQPDMGYETFGSLGSYLGVDQNVPILTVEFRRGQDEASAAAALRKGLAAVVLAAKVSGATTASDNSADAGTLTSIARDIEGLKEKYPQLAAFSTNGNLDAEKLAISYAYRTHAAKRAGGWTSGVPNPDEDGIWFHLDFHDPASVAQIHTQPVSINQCLGNKVVGFLILEGPKTNSVNDALWRILRKHGVAECPDHQTDKKTNE